MVLGALLLMFLTTSSCLASCPDITPPSADYCQEKISPASHGGFPSYEYVGPGSCRFNYESSLCNYTQGCRDSVDEWSQEPSRGAVMIFKNALPGQFSALKSPEIQVDHIACLFFWGHAPNTAQLSVHFGQNITDSCTVVDLTTGDSFIRTMHIRNATGRIFFRAVRGSAAGLYVDVTSVFFEDGRCEVPDCDFDKESEACDSLRWMGWTVASMTTISGTTGKAAILRYDQPYGTLTTDLVRATGAYTGCLNFAYKMNGTNDALSVWVEHTNGDRVLVWKVVNVNTSSEWTNATLPIKSYKAFFIVFRAQRCYSGQATDMAVDNIVFRRSSTGCRYAPQLADPQDQGTTTVTPDPPCDLPVASTSTEAPDVANTSAEASDVATPSAEAPDVANPSAEVPAVPGTSPRPSTADGSSTDMSSTESSAGPGSPKDGKNDDNLPVIAGVTVAVVVVVAVAAGVVVWRRRKNPKSSEPSDGRSTANNIEENMTPVTTDTNGDETEVYDVIDSSALSSEPVDGTSGETAVKEISPVTTDTSGEQTDGYEVPVVPVVERQASSLYIPMGDGNAMASGSAVHTAYEQPGTLSPPSDYTPLENTAGSVDVASAYYNVAPENSGYYNADVGRRENTSENAK